MAYVLIIAGLLLTISGAQGTQDALFTQLQKDFTGNRSFIYWLAAIAVIGGIGYIPEFKGLSRAFLTLVLIVLILSNKGAFEQFTAALGGTTLPAPDAKLTTGTGEPVTVERQSFLDPNLFGDYSKLPDYMSGTA